MMHVAIAEMLVNRLTPDGYQEPVVRSPGLLRAMLSRIAARLWAGTAAHEMDAQDLDAQVERLAAISPHLLVDIGIDPVTLEMLDPEALPQPAPAVPDTSPAAVVPAREDRRPIRLRPAHRSLPVGLAPA